MATTYYSDCGWFGWGKEEADIKDICVSGASYCGENVVWDPWMQKCAGPDGPACDENSSWNANRGQCMPSEKADPVYKTCGLFGLFKTEADLSTACPGGYVYCDQGTAWDAPSAQCILDADASACSATQYRDASGQCVSHSPECSSNQYESGKPTAERDRECRDCSSCVSSVTYISKGCASDSDRICSEYNPCSDTDKFVDPFSEPDPGQEIGRDQDILGTDVTCASKIAGVVCEKPQDVPPMMFTWTQTDSNTLECMGHCTGDYYKNDIGVCTPHSAECSTDEYESSPPSATSDRVCTALTACTASQYQSTVPTVNSDRVCTPLTECVGGYESQAPTAIADRVCTPHTVCTAGEEYETQAPTAIADRGCTALTACTAGQYESQAPTANSDRGCTDHAPECTADQYQSQAPTANSDRVCAAYSVECNDNQYESQEQTDTSDRECTDYSVNCSAEEYQEEDRTAFADRQCASLTTCNPDEYQEVPPNKNDEGVNVTDRTCTSLTVCNDSQTLGTYADPQQNLTQTEVTDEYSHYTADQTCVKWSECSYGAYNHYDARSSCRVHQDIKEQQVDDVDECKAKCDQTDTCNGFVYMRDSNLCELKYLVLPLDPTKCTDHPPLTKIDTYVRRETPQYEDVPPNAVRDRTCKDLTPKCPDDQYENIAPKTDNTYEHYEKTRCDQSDDLAQPCSVFAEGRNYGGNDVMSFDAGVATSPGECARLCHDFSTYFHYRDDGLCWCKDALAGAGTAHTGMWYGEACRDVLTTDTVEECKALCDEDDTCNAFGYKTDGTCHLKQYRTPFESSACAIDDSEDTYVSNKQYTSDRSCADLKKCGVHEFESVAPTKQYGQNTTDRTCQAHRECSETQYESEAPGPKKNRTCTPLTECNGSTNPGTWADPEDLTLTFVTDQYSHFTTDRQCIEWSDKCANGVPTEGFQYDQANPDKLEYQEKAPTSTNDRVCKALTPKCPPHQYQSSAPEEDDDGQYISDRVCENLTVCDSAHYEKAAPLKDDGQYVRNRTCVRLKTCQVDQFESQKPTLHSQECQFATDRECTDLTQCTGNSFVSVWPKKEATTVEIPATVTQPSASNCVDGSCQTTCAPTTGSISVFFDNPEPLASVRVRARPEGQLVGEHTVSFTRDGTTWIGCGSFNEATELHDHACLGEDGKSIQDAKGVRVTASQLAVSQVAAMKPTGTQKISDQDCMTCDRDGDIPVWSYPEMDEIDGGIKCKTYEEAKGVTNGSYEFEETVKHFCDDSGPDGRNDVTLARLANHDASTVQQFCKDIRDRNYVRMTRRMIKDAGLKSRTAGPTDELSADSPHGYHTLWHKEYFDPDDTEPDSKIRQCGGAWGHCLNAQVLHGKPLGNVKIDHAIPWKDGFEKYTYDDYHEAMEACDLKDGKDGNDACQGFKVGRVYFSLNPDKQTDRADINKVRGGAEGPSCDVDQNTQVVTTGSEVDVDSGVVTAGDQTIGMLLPIGTMTGQVKDSDGNVVGVRSADGAVVADSATCANYSVKQCQERGDPNVCCKECSDYVGDKSAGRKAYLMADYCGSGSSDTYTFERHGTTLTCPPDDTVAVTTRGARHAKCTYDGDDDKDIRDKWQNYQELVSNYEGGGYDYSSNALAVNAYERCTNSNSCAAVDPLICSDTNCTALADIPSECPDNDDNCRNKQEKFREVLATICMSEPVKTDLNDPCCGICREIRNKQFALQSPVEFARNDAKTALQVSDTDQTCFESKGYNGEEYFNGLSSFVKKEWLFDRISGKITTTPKLNVKKVDWCKQDEHWVDTETPGYCAKSDGRQVNRTVTCDAPPLQFPRTVDMAKCACDDAPREHCGQEIFMT